MKLHHQTGKAQTSRCSTVLRRFAENFVGTVRLEDGSACQLRARPLISRAGRESLRVGFFAFGQRFEATLRPSPKTEPWQCDFAGLLAVGTERRYFVGASFLRSGLLKFFLIPLHLYTTPPVRLEVVP